MYYNVHRQAMLHAPRQKRLFCYTNQLVREYGNRSLCVMSI